MTGNRAVGLGPARLERRPRRTLDAASRPPVAARGNSAGRRLSGAGPVGRAAGGGRAGSSPPCAALAHADAADRDQFGTAALAPRNALRLRRRGLMAGARGCARCRARSPPTSSRSWPPAARSPATCACCAPAPRSGTRPPTSSLACSPPNDPRPPLALPRAGPVRLGRSTGSHPQHPGAARGASVRGSFATDTAGHDGERRTSSPADAAWPRRADDRARPHKGIPLQGAANLGAVADGRAAHLAAFASTGPQRPWRRGRVKRRPKPRPALLRSASPCPTPARRSAAAGPGPAWLLLRDERRAAALAPGGTLGGSQAGARLAYRIGARAGAERAFLSAVAADR